MNRHRVASIRRPSRIAIRRTSIRTGRIPIRGTIIITTHIRTRTSRARTATTTRTSVGRLEDIVERNRNPKGNRERMTVMIGLGVFLLLILGMMVFTKLGLRPEPAAPPAGSASRDHHVDDVPIRAPRPPQAAGSGAATR